MTVKTLAVACPTCKKQVLMTPEFPQRPFCSDRCKSIDFGDWAMETHAIPGPSLMDGENEIDFWSESTGREE